MEWGSLQIDEDEAGCRVRFGETAARAISLDIAIIQLGAALLDDARLRAALIDALRGPIAIETARKNGAIRRHEGTVIESSLPALTKLITGQQNRNGF